MGVIAGMVKINNFVAIFMEDGVEGGYLFMISDNRGVEGGDLVFNVMVEVSKVGGNFWKDGDESWG